MIKRKTNIIHQVYLFYLNGFRSMTWGRKLWVIILIKIFVFFVLLKLFFFQDFLGSKFDTDEEKADYVIREFKERKKPVDNH